MAVHGTDFGTVELLEFGDGPLLVTILHAAASSPRALRRLADRLAAPERRVLLPALAGYGATAVTGPGDALDRHIRVARWALDAYPAEHRVLVGHSMGGLVALKSALAAAEVDAVVAIEPIAFGALDRTDPGDAAAADWDRAIIDNMQTQIAAGREEAGVAAFVEAWNETAWSDLPIAARAALIAAAPQLAAETRAVLQDAQAASTLDVRAPVLLLHGDRSPPAIGRIVDRLAATLPAASRQSIADCGHMGPVTAPDAYARAVEAFVATR